MKVLLTGGASFIGSRLAEALLAQGDSVISNDFTYQTPYLHLIVK